MTGCPRLPLSSAYIKRERGRGKEDMRCNGIRVKLGRWLIS